MAEWSKLGACGLGGQCGLGGSIHLVLVDWEVSVDWVVRYTSVHHSLPFPFLWPDLHPGS